MAGSTNLVSEAGSQHNIPIALKERESESSILQEIANVDHHQLDNKCRQHGWDDNR